MPVHVFIQSLLSCKCLLAELTCEVPSAHVTFNMALKVTFSKKLGLAIDAVELLHSRVSLDMKPQLAFLPETPSAEITEVCSFVHVHGKMRSKY